MTQQQELVEGLQPVVEEVLGQQESIGSTCHEDAKNMCCLDVATSVKKKCLKPERRPNTFVCINNVVC